MRLNSLKSIVKAAVLGASVLLLGAGIASAQQQINLTAAAGTITLPDGSAVPMWGYTCGAVATGSTATCANQKATGWSPVVITVPTTAAGGLTINLTNNLTVPTSITIVGQLGGGLGTVGTGCTGGGATCTTPPDHSNAQGATTWPIAGGPGATAPAQSPRAQSFSSEVAPGATALLPAWATLRPGTYLIESGTHPSIQGPMGLYGVLVVTTAPSGTTAGTAYPGVTYNSEIPLVLGEIDPVQNNAVSTAVGTPGFSETMVWSGKPGGCADPTSLTYHQCYPPAVNYTPLYYTINGQAFDKTNVTASTFAASAVTGVAAGTPGSVLVRFVNAGSRMHIPSIVGAQTGAAKSGFSLIAEDGNPLPGSIRIQSEVFMAAGKTYDVMVNVPAAGSTALPVFDRQLSLSGNAIGHDTGMFGYISVNGASAPGAAGFGAAIARADTYSNVAPGQTFSVSDPSKGLIANDTNVYGVQLLAAPTAGTVVLNPDGTFTYTANAGTTSDSFSYCANGTVTGTTCSSGISTTVTLTQATADVSANITCASNISFSSNSSNYINVKTPGILATCKDSAGYPLTVDISSISAGAGLTVHADSNGGFVASTGSTSAAAATGSFTFKAKSSYGVLSAPVAVNISFLAGSGLTVKVLDGQDKVTPITDYRWIIEEDRTFYIDPNCTTNPPAAGCLTTTNSSNVSIVPTFGTNFHTSYMPLVATGCTGTLSCENGQKVGGVLAVCDVGNGVCRKDAVQQTPVDPSQVHLDPTKRYYISVLPGDAANPFNSSNVQKGHSMGGAPVSAPCKPATTCTASFAPVTVFTQPTPLQTAKLSVFVFEDDFPLNGENDAGGQDAGSQEPGLGGFNITLFDDAGGTGDATGQMTYDMFNMPLSNSLAGTPDPANGGIDACPISKQATTDPTQKGITGTIVTCPTYEADGKTLSPLAGQAVVANLMPGRFGVVATPAADRIARGEEWLQTNTLDGQKAHDSFLRVGEPNFFQEYGPASYHVSIGFANPQIINARKAQLCKGIACSNSVTGTVTTERMSRTPDERLYSSGDNSSFAFTQCYVSLGDPTGADFAFTKCAADGSFKLSGLPDGDWRVTVFDQWNDMLVDGLSTPVRLAGGATADLGQIATNQWQANIYTSTFFDPNRNGIRDPGEPGLALVPTNIRFRDGSFSNFNNTDLDGNAGFNEVFPLFSWYVVETDSTRYKNTGTHVVYDSGGPADGTCTSSTGPCGSSTIGANMANTYEPLPLPVNLHVPGATYCLDGDCNFPSTGSPNSTARIDPPWVVSEGWQGFSGQNSFLEFGKTPFAVGENGGIRGEVVYDSTRPFDDPSLNLHLSWTPNIPNVTVNLYKENTAPDGSVSLSLFDTTKTSSFDDWAQGFHPDPTNPSAMVPNMNCPGQGRDTGTNADLFFFSLFDQPNYLDFYNSQHGGGPITKLPADSQFKCYDGMHNWNQLQPAPYDGAYSFPSVTSRDPVTGKPTGTNCSQCVANPDSSDSFRFNTPMLPAGKYVVEVVVPPGYELVKEEDKNILIGDNFIAPVTQEFGPLSSIYILPDQAAISAEYNANNAQNSTNDLGRTTYPASEADTGNLEQFWPCVGQARVVPDFISLFPQSGEVAPFAGATRNLCDRKEIAIADQMSAVAKFYLFTSTHAAAHFTGVITDDFTSEFDPFSPQFGEKFAPPDMPISIKDWSGTEISRIYTDHWGAYNGLNYSTWEVNPPNPTGYSPTMMITCMNDPGTGVTPDPLYNPQYSNFCYEIPFMPGQTQYMDTPVVPTSAFASAGYNNPDCAYPDATPAIKEVDGDGIGPWVSAAGHTLTITSLGDQAVPNNAYSGPAATTAPFNQKKITRHYGFGATQGTGSVTIGGIAAAVTSWSDTSIVVTVPTGVSNCPRQQQAQYSGLTPNVLAQCGELVITAGNGKQSVDTVNVTIGGKAPTALKAGQTIQSAIDAAEPGDLIIVPAGQYPELVVMWKPVRLQGVGAASSIINANTQPAGKINDWRARVNCLFGLALNGMPVSTTNPFDPTSTVSCGSTGGSAWTGWSPTANNPQVDRLPLEATIGWNAALDGNNIELLQEPTLMGALEGAAITVLSKGVKFPSDPFAAEAFPAGTVLFTDANLASSQCGPNSPTAHNPFPSNFLCNPSRIDGLGITNSSQGGGGIFVHGWGHYLEISNNRVYNNAGTLSGGINVGQGDAPPAYLGGAANAGNNAAPGSCQSSSVNNLVLPYCQDVHVNVHHNAIVANSSTGDQLFSATPARAGGVSFCTGSDYYSFNYNWVCGNLSAGDGGGLAHVGFIYNGDIEHNSFLFNQSTNPTTPTNGGAILVMGAADADAPCTARNAADCSAPGTVGPSDGTGPLLTINANLIMGNSADSGTGGGIAIENVNGSDVVSFPTDPTRWNRVALTNNIITNNVAGWDGAGISILDALNTDIINNTIASNDTTASSGVLFNTLGEASTQGPTCTANCGTSSAPQPAGLVSIQNSAVLMANLPTSIVCPSGHYSGTTATNGTCRTVSYPKLENNVLWKNRSFYIGVGAFGSGTQSQQHIVTLYDAFTNTAAASQPSTDATTANGSGVIITGGTGACVAGVSYWDIGVRGDTGPTNHNSTVTLNPTYSVMTSTTGYNTNNTIADPTFVTEYCNGSRVPPEFQSGGYLTPPGISDATSPNPVFNLTPAATVDEGNNWINLSWGPLAMSNPIYNTPLSNYGPAAGSSVINFISAAGAPGNYADAPPLDFFGNARKTNNAVDAGAVEFGAGPATAIANITPTSLNFGTVPSGTNSTIQTLTLHNTGTANLTGIAVAVTGPFSRVGGTCGGTLTPAAGTCTITIRFSPLTPGPASGTLTITANVIVTGSPVALTGTGGPALGALSFALTGTNPSGVSIGSFTILGFSVPTLQFGLQTGAPITAHVSVTNTGGSPVVFTSAITFTSILNNIFTQTNNCPIGGTGLAVGASCTLNVTMTPPTTSTGTTRVSFYTFTDNGTGSPQILGVTGR